jgi:hypothetical protein
MNPTPFSTMDQDFGVAFGTGIQSAITSLLSAVATPLLACVTLYDDNTELVGKLGRRFEHFLHPGHV